MIKKWLKEALDPTNLAIAYEKEYLSHKRERYSFSNNPVKNYIL